MTLNERLEAMRGVAYDWHGGQSSPLYSFASTGKVWDAAHRASILAEIDENDGAAETEEAAAGLIALRKYIASEIVNDGGAVTLPLGEMRRPAREMCEAMWFALRALEVAQRVPSGYAR